MKRYLMDFLKECQGKFKRCPAFMYREGETVKEVSIQEFLLDVERKCMYFEKLPEERVGLWAYNSYEWITAAMAMILAGKTAILLDGNLNVGQLARLCHYADVELIVADGEMMDEEEAAACFPMISLAEAVCGERDQEGRMPNGREGDLICFTSGTSKSSKGVVITMQSFCNCLKEYKEIVMGKAEERVYLPLPYHHIFAFYNILQFLYHGVINCIGQMGRYLIEDFEVMKPEALFCVPSMLHYLIQRDYFPEQFRTIFTGGSCLRPELGNRILAKNIELYNTYGSTESIGLIGFTGTEKGLQWFKPIPGIRFVTGQNGELGLLLTYHMEGYYKRPEDTQKVLDKEQKLLWTGDACELDEDGYAKLLGRIRDMIVLENGEKIHAEDTDAELSDFPGVKEAAVIYVREKLIAVFCPEADGRKRQIREELKNYNKGRSSAVQIREVWFREEELPKTTTKKLKRAALEQEYENKAGKRCG